MGEENTMIYKNLANIQAEVEAIAKERKNTTQHYNFRGIEDVLNMIHKLLAKHKVVVIVRKVGSGLVEERDTRSGGRMITRINDYEFDFIAVDGSKVTVGPIPGEGADTGDKASNKTLANAYKYAMFLTFSIPTQGLVDEPDSESPEGDKSKRRGRPRKTSSKESGDSYQGLREQFDKLLASDEFDEKEIKQAKSMASKIKPDDLNSLKNLIKAWERKNTNRNQTTPENQQKDSAQVGSPTSQAQMVEDIFQGETVGLDEVAEEGWKNGD